MSSFRTQSRLALSNGIVVERLPMGFAAGRWWATFVYAVPGWEPGDPFFDWGQVLMNASVGDAEGRLEPVGGSGGGNEREYTHTWELVDRGAARAEVRYADHGERRGVESLSLDPTDRDGYFAVRLADGSLIERLPVGHALGHWRLRWVRTDIPAWELDVENDDDGLALDMPDRRFLRLRAAGRPLGRLDASASGGRVQFFSVDVPDTAADLQIEYVLGDTSAGAETPVLPDKG